MTILDDIRNSSAGRTLLAARTAREAFERRGWEAREGAVYSRGIADVAARRVWTRGQLRAGVRVVVRCHAGARQVVFSEVAASGEDALPSYWLGEDDPLQRRAIADLIAPEALQRAAYRRGVAVTAAANVAALPAKIVANAFRELDAEAPSIAATVQDALHCVEVIQSDLLQHDLEMFASDREAGGDPLDGLNVHSREVIHPVVIADAELWTLDGKRRPWLRLRQPSVVSADQRWIDVVAGEHVETYIDALAQHYAGAFRRKQFGR